jgi:hypothetical protein
MAQVVLQDWGAPALEGACAWVVERFARRGVGRGELDLSGVVVVTPGRRAGRILLAMLVDRAEREGLWLTPPRLATPGDLPGVLVEGVGPVAGPAATLLAFIEAALGLDKDDRASLTREADTDFSWALGVARLTLKAVEELSGQLVPIERAAEAAEALGGEREGRRWRALGRLWEQARRSLAGHGLGEHASALMESAGEPGLASRLKPGVRAVLVGVTELPGAARRVLSAMGDAVTALVFGDDASAFDELGTIRPEVWAARTPDLSRASIEFVEDAREQAHAALAAVGDLGARLPADRITIGTPDEEVAFWIERLAERAGGVEVRDAAGWPVERTGPWRLLTAAAELARTRSFGAFAAFVRHPDVEHHLRRRLGGGEYLRAMDRFERERLPRSAGRWDWVTGDMRRILDGAWEVVTGLMGEAWSAEANGREPRAWGGEALELLRRVYGERRYRTRVPEEARAVEACLLLRDAAADLASASGIGAAIPAWEGLGLVLSLARGGRIAAEPSRDAVEMLGWLELPLDPGAALVVTGMNEGSVPAARGVDGLLPERLRERLGLETDAARAARDAYVLSALAASGRELVLIAGRRSGEGVPLLPSRLLFAGDDGEAVGRVRRFLDGRLRRRVSDEAGSCSGFAVDERPETPTVKSIRVTSFARYLRSPYEFYLIDVLGLDEPDEGGDELEARVVGELLHEALRRFGEGAGRCPREERRIGSELLGHLGDLVRERFGADADDAGLPMIPRVELEFARRWLASAAAWQARAFNEGWNIEHVEWKPTRDVQLDVDGVAITLRGRIDRIDAGPGGWRIIDFKTGSVHDPDRSHRSWKGEFRTWVDLQLPLYRHLAAELNLQGRVELGYVGMVKKSPRVEWLPAPWDEEDLRSADEAAREVVRRIRAGEFSDPGDPAVRDGSLAALIERARGARRAGP